MISNLSDTFWRLLDSYYTAANSHSVIQKTNSWQSNSQDESEHTRKIGVPFVSKCQLYGVLWTAIHATYCVSILALILLGSLPVYKWRGL